MIVSLSYLKTERLGVSEASRKAVFDLYCENEKGEKFIVELQKTNKMTNKWAAYKQQFGEMAGLSRPKFCVTLQR